MAKAKAKNEFTELVSEVGSALLSNRRSVLAEADSILERISTEGRELNYEELDFLQSVVGWTTSDIQGARRRVNNRLRLQAIAGTSEDREQLDALCCAAEDELHEREPVITAELSRLQAELDALEKNHTQLHRRREEVNAALDGLTKVVSPAVASAVNSKKHAIKETLGRELSDKQVELGEIKTLLAGPDVRLLGISAGASRAEYFRKLRQFDHECVMERAEGPEGGHRMLSYAYSPKWQVVQAELAAKVEPLEREIAELESRLAEELEDIQFELRQYWR